MLLYPFQDLDSAPGQLAWREDSDGLRLSKPCEVKEITRGTIRIFGVVGALSFGGAGDDRDPIGANAFHEVFAARTEVIGLDVVHKCSVKICAILVEERGFCHEAPDKFFRKE